MKKRFTLGVVLLALGGMALAQPQKPSTRQPAADPLTVPDAPQPPRVAPTRADPSEHIPAPSVTPTTPPATHPVPALAPPLSVTKPEDLTIDQLLEGIEALRNQKEEMEKKEKAMLKVLRQKAEKLSQRISNLDPESLPAPRHVPPPPTVSN